MGVWVNVGVCVAEPVAVPVGGGVDVGVWVGVGVAVGVGVDVLVAVDVGVGLKLTELVLMPCAPNPLSHCASVNPARCSIVSGVSSKLCAVSFWMSN